MKILLITNKDDLTCDFIVREVKKNGIDFYRFNTEELTKSVFVTLNFFNNKFEINDRNLSHVVDITQFTSVYYRRPELPILNNNLTSGEQKFILNEIIYTLEGIYRVLKKCFWISSVYSIREAENKPFQLSLAKAIGFKIPNSIITNDFLEGLNFFKENNSNCIIKPIKSGLIENESGNQVIFTSKLSNFPDENDKIESCPIYIQEHIKKLADIRVIVVGKMIFSTLIDSQANENTTVDWRKGNQKLTHTKIKLPKDISQLCKKLLIELNLSFGAIDLVKDIDGNYIFLEINPNGQWAWIELRTGYEISREIVKLFTDEYNKSI